MELTLLEGYNGGKIRHQTVGCTNYNIKKIGIVSGGFTQPEIGMAFIKESTKTITGYAQRHNFHFINSKNNKLRGLKVINPQFKKGIIEDVLYPLLKDSTLRGSLVKKYMLIFDSEAFLIFEQFHDEFIDIKEKLQAKLLPGYDIVLSYIGKMYGKVVRESAILTELLPRLKKSLENSKFTGHSTPKNRENVQKLTSKISPIINDNLKQTVPDFSIVDDTIEDEKINSSNDYSMENKEDEDLDQSIEEYYDDSMVYIYIINNILFIIKLIELLLYEYCLYTLFLIVNNSFIYRLFLFYQKL